MACLSCAWEESNGTKIDTSRSKTEWGQRIGVSEAAIRRHLMHPGTISIPSEPNLGVRGDSKSIDTTGTVKITKTADRIIPLSEWLDDLRDDGHDPDQFNCSHAHSVWGQQSTENGLITLYANRFTAVKKTRKEALEETFDYTAIDPVGILAQLRADRHPISPAWEEGGDESTFVLSINDIQLGQSYNGGSAATIANFYRYIELAKRRISDLRVLGRSLDTVVLVIGGDLVEGCVIYPNQSFSLDLNRKQQIKGVIGLLLHAFDELVPMFQRARVLACKGNHGEHRINGKMTALGDNDDTHCVEMAKLALDRDPAMRHIEWVIAEDEAAVAMDVYGWVLVTTHGDVYAKGVSGATTERKAHAWLKNMAASVKHFGKLGLASVLITHHFHHDEMADWGDCLWRQTTSQDRGSPGFSQATGGYSEPGMLTGVMMPGHRWRDEEVLR